MAESLSDIFKRLLGKQQILVERYHVLEEKLNAADDSIRALEEERNRQKARIEQLEMENGYLRIARRIAPDEATMEASRVLIAKLVRDVDKCIEQLNE